MVNLKNILNKRILIFDGAMGTSIEKLNLNEKEYGGKKYFGCNEILNLNNPKLIEKIHDQYFEAGADIIGTNTFSANPISLKEYNLHDKTYEINYEAGKIALKSAKKYSTKKNPKFVFGCVGPTNISLSLNPNIKFDKLKQAYSTQIKGLMDSGVDAIIIETVYDTLNAKSAGIAFKEISNKLNKKIPLIISITIEQIKRTNQGKYLKRISQDETILKKPTNFCIGVAAHPNDSKKRRIKYLKKKFQSGAEFAIT